MVEMGKVWEKGLGVETQGLHPCSALCSWVSHFTPPGVLSLMGKTQTATLPKDQHENLTVWRMRSARHHVLLTAGAQ